MPETEDIAEVKKNLESKIVKINRLNAILGVFLLISIFISSILVLNLVYPLRFLPQSQTATKQEVLNIIKQNAYVDLPSQTLQDEGELKGIVASLNDPYSEYLAKSDSSKLQDQLNERYEGIGVRFQNKDGKVLVNSVISNSPAKDGGVSKGDELKKVDDTNVATLDINQLTDKIRGPKDSKVRLTLFRSGNTFEVELTRRPISPELITLDVVNNTGIITISSFGNGLDTKMNEIANQVVKNKNITKLILDLRGNTGGLLNEEIEVVSYFVEPNEVLIQEKSKKSTEVKKSVLKNVSLKSYSLEVLVDHYSASASEILAGSLRDIRGVKLIGQTTYGKGVVQNIYDLSNGDSLKLTIAEWLTPKGYTINKTGLKPDQEVSLNQDILDVVLTGR